MFIIVTRNCANVASYLEKHPSIIKSATTEAVAQKTQTPIVAKLTQCEMGISAHINTDGICIFIKFTVLFYDEISLLSQKENKPNFTCIKLVWHSYHIIALRVCQEEECLQRRNKHSWGEYCNEIW